MEPIPNTVDDPHALFQTTNKNQMEKSSAVRVGVRVRPFTSKEIAASRSSQSVLTCIREGTQEIRLGSRRFTYDAVFDESVSQEALYQSLAGPLMGNFLEGFNATIMAYGQTGSGKTYTMGSEAHDDTEISTQTGIIPRFMRDLFINLEKRKAESSAPDYNGPILTDFSLTASFLEVYGEDVHDLLVPSRPCVPVREDANGGIVCTGLTECPISTAEEALQVLHEGTMHRTTAATLMNLTSSRSHAVFAVTLTQKTAVPTSGEMTDTTTVSRLTFVDLAGSERMKKTGAEGERAREGIKINEGLLALGNVINALADQKKIDEGKKVHVPYRQSKLTRLLQDALGGNSQTLFLACVSPSDTNASETLSTLHYANRARNIRNAPVQNVDSSLLELRRLRAWSQILQNELLRHKFGVEKSEKIGTVDDEILIRGEVQEYLQELQTIAMQETTNTKPLNSLLLTASCTAPPTKFQSEFSGSTSRGILSVAPHAGSDENAMELDTTMNQSVLDNFDPAILTEVNPDHEMAILNQLLELHQRDQAFDDEQKEENAALEKMEGDIAEQETLLLQLRDSLKVYHHIKNKYEVLMAEVQQLEAEKSQLASQLEKATADPTQGCSSAIRRQLDKVEKSLVRARNETQKHRDQYRKLEKEQQKCQALERKIADLKNGKAAMIKKQRDAAARHREFTEAKTREIVALKRKERNAEKRVSKLQTEVQIHKRNLEKRQQFIQKLNDKLKQTESHLMKLLSTRQRNLQDRMSIIHSRSSISTNSSVLAPGRDSFLPTTATEVKSARFLVDRFVSEKVAQFQLEKQYQGRVEEYAVAMKDMMDAVEELRKLRTEAAPDTQTLSDALQSVEDSELKVELISADVESLRSQMIEKDKLLEMEKNLSKVIESQPVPVLRTMLIGLLDQHVSSEQRRSETDATLRKKQRTVETLEQEIDILNRKIAAYSNESAKRNSLATMDEDPFRLIQSLKDEKASLESLIKEKDDEITVLRKEINHSECIISQKSIGYKESQQKLAVLEAATNKELHAQRALGVLSQIHTIWREIGISSESDDDVLRSIENCLEDTCERKLEDARLQRKTLISAVEDICKRLAAMQASLGVEAETPPTFSTILAKKEYVENVTKKTLPKFKAATEQAEQIISSLTAIQSALALDQSELPASLSRLLDEASGDTYVRNLTPEFLSSCEEELSLLRVRKSEILIQNNKRQSEISAILKDMNLVGLAAQNSLILEVEKQVAGLPSWWNTETANRVCNIICTEPSIPLATRDYTDHLATVHEAVLAVASGNRKLAEGLQGLIERAQEVLLSTVEGGHDAIEACASFREALLRLPKLSKERIETCLLQITDLIPGVDAMIRSEIEALTVLWEALGTPTADRGKFWETIDESIAATDSKLFEDVLSMNIDKSGWLYRTAKESRRGYSSLEKKLLKLETVHKEVETLRARQNAKSKVLSLDSEVRLLNAQLMEFEEKTCSKDRLLSRQAGSSQLLREERYRKQMKSKFSSKLEQLADLLKVWNEKNSSDFDPNILSDDVRMLLDNASWIDERKEFMHLRTTKAKRVGKRRIQRTGSSESDSSTSPVDKKTKSATPQRSGPLSSKIVRHSRKTASVIGAGTPRQVEASTVKPEIGSQHLQHKRKCTLTKSIPKPQTKKRRTDADGISSSESTPPPRSTSNMTASQKIPVNVFSSKQVNASKETEKTKRMTLLPFGHVLEQASTPRSKSAGHENMFTER